MTTKPEQQNLEVGGTLPRREFVGRFVGAGALAALLEIDMEVVHGMLNEKFGKKKALKVTLDTSEVTLLEQAYEARAVLGHS